MVPLNPIRGRVRPAILIAVLMAGIALPAMAASSFFGPQAPAGNDGRIEVAQNNNQNAAQLLVRIQDLEQQVRDLTGRVEGLEFQVQQLLKVNQDNEFRFQQLEGTAPVGKPQAAVPTDGATPSDALPQEQNPATADTSADQLPATPDEAIAAPDLPASDVPMDGSVGESADPLLKGGTDQLGTLDEGVDAAANQPLDLNFDGNTAISTGDAKAQFEAGRDAMNRGDYAFASDQLTQFLQYYPRDPSAPDAVNYLGEALIQQKDFQQASQVLAQGYIDYAKSNRAPDIMLRLGVALSGLGQGDLACENFTKLRERYPNTAPAFKQRVDQEAQKAQCPAG